MTLWLEHLSFAYAPGAPVVVDDLSAAAQPGRITAIIGPNAAGKSTLLRLMAGLLEPQRGRVSLDDADIHRMEARARAARLAFVPQRPRVDAPFTVREVVALGRYALSPKPSAIEAALQQCALSDDADRVFNALSVGQQQRAALARALAQAHGATPAALLLDEPTSALDPRHVQQTAAILRQCAAQGRVVVVILHDLILARQLADDLWLMDRGRLAADGPVDEVYQAPLLERIYGVPFATSGGVLLAQKP